MYAIEQIIFYPLVILFSYEFYIYKTRQDKDERRKQKYSYGVLTVAIVFAALSFAGERKKESSVDPCS